MNKLRLKPSLCVRAGAYKLEYFMHTLSRRRMYDEFDLNLLFDELDAGNDPTDQDMLPTFNEFKAAGGDDWKDIRIHCENWSEDEDEDESSTD